MQPTPVPLKNNGKILFRSFAEIKKNAEEDGDLNKKQKEEIMLKCKMRAQRSHNWNWHEVRNHWIILL